MKPQFWIITLELIRLNTHSLLKYRLTTNRLKTPKSDSVLTPLTLAIIMMCWEITIKHHYFTAKILVRIK